MGRTALVWVDWEDHQPIVQFLFDQGANINVFSRSGATPIFIAAQVDNTDLVNLLLRLNANVNLARYNVERMPAWTPESL